MNPRLPFILIRCLLLLAASSATSAFAATSISQFGITWTFSTDKTVGQFVNGDYWVVGPVTIISISPASTTTAGRTINGSMINPLAGLTVPEGFDSAMGANTYVAALNVARPGGANLSATNPLIVPPSSSLISSISHPTPGIRPQLTDAAVLTVLAAAPPANSFRPPYCGPNKTIIATEADIDYSKVRSLPKPSSTPDIAVVSSHFVRPWIDINTEWIGREWHPSNNQEDYGREIGKQLSEALLILQLNFTNAQKRELMVRLLQYGMDIYGSAVNGGFWRESGGHNQGRKMPLLFAATVLNNASIRAYANPATHFIFQEDRTTFYVSQTEVSFTHSKAWDPDTRAGTPEAYEQSDIGTAEWGIHHVRDPSADNRYWGTVYRDIAGSATIGHILTAHIMGLKSTWNWPPAFDYYDRFWPMFKDTRVGVNTPSRFERDMWIAYRGTDGLVAVPTAPKVQILNN
ncbi:MAG: hypothetical protein JWM32_569 [Verrucomicrobia bacterium]|nr:hypothetical protein [Verrucomicrobiota bacterium]